MKKAIRVIKNLFLGAFGIIASLLIVLALWQQLALHQEKALLENAYGQMVTVEGKQMCVDIAGSGEEVIVLTPGMGATSPVLEMKGLIEALKDQYTVVTVEPFGYGLSDRAETPRTIEHISSELHEAISQLGYKKYILMGHSISGIYALYYSQQYPDEVMAYVGIDSSVPGQEQEGSMRSCKLLSWMNKLGIYRLLAKVDEEGVVPTLAGYKYTDYEAKVYEALVFKNFFNKNVINEYELSANNFEQVETMKFPDTLPVLYFLSSDNCTQTPQWSTLHQAVITKHTEGEITVIEGSHYLHEEKGEALADQLSKWRRENA